MGEPTVLHVTLPRRLRPGFYWPRRDGAFILVHDELDPREAAFVVEHERAHHHRGGGIDRPWMPSSWRTRVALEERQCDRLAAEALVPVTDLARFCDERADHGEGVGPEEVMHEFDCSRRTAEHALENLTRHERSAR